MTIRVIRNESGNCVQFEGTTLPVYWNSCLSARANQSAPDHIDVVNDIETGQTGVEKQELTNIHYTEFADKNGSAFNNVDEAIEYINVNANVLGTTGNGVDLLGETVCFTLDDTSTSIMVDNGYSFGVNTIKAVANADGTIHIISNNSSSPRTHFIQLEVGRACNKDGVIAGGINDIVNSLNELFTVGPFEAVVIADPFSTMVADVDGVDAGYTLEGNDAIDPLGPDIFTYDGNGYANYAGLKSTDTIDQAGEYFTFDIHGEGTIGFGLVHSAASYSQGKFVGNSSYADPTTFATVNSAHYGYQFSHWFHPTPNGSWTNYGAATGYVGGSGWSNWDQQQDWLDGNPVKIRCGIDANGYISIESLQDDGTWVLHSRSNYVLPEGAELHLGIKSQSPNSKVFSIPKVHLLEPEAPTMYFRYIESPDGVFHYPVFVTAEEAEYYDEVHNGLTAGTGSSHTHTYVDDPTNTTWYMPEASHDPTNYSYSYAPVGTETFDGNVINWTEITSLDNADLTPNQFSNADLTYQEGTVVNMPLSPVDATYTTSAVISPAGSGLVYNSSTTMLQGTLSDVTSNTTYTVTVTRANSYGSSVGSFTITATDVAPPQTNETPWTKALDFSGSNEHSKQTNSSSDFNAIKMGGLSQTAPANSDSSKTSNGTYSRPWATAIVFKADLHNSNQHIWNSGEGSNTGADNIYLRLSATGNLMFGWGRSNYGSQTNECVIGTNISSSNWYGVYIAHSGTRLSSSDATASNLANAFDIRIMSSSDSFTALGSNLSTSSNWTSSNASMSRSFTGDFTVGGRGSNRNFHGKVASMVVTTLRRNVAMPTEAEVKLMITDPKKWEDDYRVGKTIRDNTSTSEWTYSPSSFVRGYGAVQMWLMGDGTSDSYSNGIRNDVYPSDQNYTKMQLNSMVSNDIQNVSIAGLT